MVNREPRPLVGHDSWKAYAKRLSSQQAVPLHVRITDLIDQLIDTGALAEGDQLPPERVLAELFGASLAPVRQAILECVNRRLLVRSRGRGTFVRTSRLEEKVSILHSFTEAMGQQRAEVETRFVSQEIVAMPLAAAQVFGEDEDRALCITRLGDCRGRGGGSPTDLSPARCVPGARLALIRRGLRVRHLGKALWLNRLRGGKRL